MSSTERAEQTLIEIRPEAPARQTGADVQPAAPRWARRFGHGWRGLLCPLLILLAIGFLVRLDVVAVEALTWTSDPGTQIQAASRSDSILALDRLHGWLDAGLLVTVLVAAALFAAWSARLSDNAHAFGLTHQRLESVWAWTFLLPGIGLVVPAYVLSDARAGSFRQGKDPYRFGLWWGTLVAAVVLRFAVPAALVHWLTAPGAVLDVSALDTFDSADRAVLAILSVVALSDLLITVWCLWTVAVVRAFTRRQNEIVATGLFT